MSRVEVIPNVLTACNLLLGVVALIMAINGNYTVGGILILCAALLDRFDGMVARRYNAETDFGREFDSLADIVSFGIAPGALMYCLVSGAFGLLGLICCCAFTLCGGLRLARYNTTPAGAYYQGVPITACGAILTLLVLLAPNHPLAIMAASLVLSLAMISTVRIPRI